MMLRRRVAVLSLLIALPAALVLTWIVGRIRANDLELALERVVRSQVNEQVRERCESDPTWFLTGPLDGRPRGGVFVESSPDQLPPRPKVTPQPFELFGYDEAFIGSSSAGARFPPDFRRALRSGSTSAAAPYVTDAGTGAQMAVATGWIASPCMYFLGRMEPPPHQARSRALTFAGFLVVSFIVALLATVPTVRRVRRLAADAHEAVDAGYTAIAPDRLKDELSSLTFVYNDVSNELQLRKARIDDLDAALRRFVQSTDEDVSRPMAALEAGIAAAAAGPAGLSLADARTLLLQTHDLAAEVENLTAAARLRALGPKPPASPVDLNALIARVIARHEPVARAAGVTVHASLPPESIVIDGDDALMERAVANVIDNAIRYNQEGGDVTVGLLSNAAEHRFRLWVTDTGRGASEEEFRGLTSIRRFRGDEGRNRRPGAPGLGLAVAREVADRYSLQLDLKRPGVGGFEVEFSGELSRPMAGA
jgi:signal transduction histidine kinase